MAVAYQAEDRFVLYVKRGELIQRGARTSKIIYWPIVVFGVLSLEEVDDYPVTRWTFTNDMMPAVAKILVARKAKLELLSKEECLERVAAVLDSNSPVDTLNPESPESPA